MARLSGLQRDVLTLYRECLRAARKKPEVSEFLHRHTFHCDHEHGMHHMGVALVTVLYTTFAYTGCIG